MLGTPGNRSALSNIISRDFRGDGGSAFSFNNKRKTAAGITCQPQFLLTPVKNADSWIAENVTPEENNLQLYKRNMDLYSAMRATNQ